MRVSGWIRASVIVDHRMCVSGRDRVGVACGRTVIVKNLAYSVGDTEEKIQNRIKRVFKVCGSVAGVRLFMDKEDDKKFKVSFRL
eukprot:768759-Rhodomonas_salina.2